MSDQYLPPLPPDVQKQLDAAQIDPTPHVLKVADFLADWPLYKNFKFSGNAIVKSRNATALPFPPLLHLYCASCKNKQYWRSSLDISNGMALLYRFSGIYEHITYVCRNCEAASVKYFLFVKASTLGGELMKVGQWPPQSREPDPVVTATWSKDDLGLFREAMTLRNSSMGIGALAYLRRVIENRMNDVLDLIDGTITRLAPKSEQELHAQLAMIKNSRRFADKLDFARDHLPKELTPRGAPNPVGFLYELVSEGLHAKSDEECIDIFDSCRTAFEYVVKKLSEAERKDNEYVQAVQTLAKGVQDRK
jgi:hypothetical protein